MTTCNGYIHFFKKAPPNEPSNEGWLGGCNAYPMSVIYHEYMWWRVKGVAAIIIMIILYTKMGGAELRGSCENYFDDISYILFVTDCRRLKTHFRPIAAGSARSTLHA
eukprot:COSAG01_NODE_2193_length_8183_cov_3.620609_6_plen_108_part_00